MAKHCVPEHTTRISGDITLHYLSEPYEVVSKPLWWHEKGLSQTRTGYGRKLTTSRCVVLPDGRKYRIYVTCFGNSGTAWIQANGLQLIVS